MKSITGAAPHPAAAGHGPAPTTPRSAAEAAGLGLTSLPTEIHVAIAQHLAYPDALSLKHASRHFRGLVRTDIQLKVAWLLERRRLHLECPSSHRCDLGSDLRFCRGSVS